LVTGGASGIGAATAARLRAAGVKAITLDRASDADLVCDVRDEAQVVAAVASAGPLDLLVNAAGIYRFAPLLEISAEEWDEVQAINLRGAFLVGREFARAAGSGAIVNVSSIAALRASRGAEPDAHYGSSKAALVALTRQMAVEWAPAIRVNAVCPGMIETPMLRITDDPAAADAFLRERVPLGRFGTADDIAALICFLLSDAAAYITGVAVPIDGGVTAL
jgi:NAD(P)-dependent dehydrogenase (short-subunit alcohol dehydrogenase family)